MAAKYQQQAQGYPLAPAAIVPRSDEEHATNYHSQEQIMKKKKRMKCFAYIAAFAVFQTIIILVFALTIMRVKTPKVRLDEVTVTNDGNGNVRFAARVLVRNRNFGRYKFESTMAGVMSEDNVNVGQFVIQDARANARSTKKMYVTTGLRTTSTNGVLRVRVEAKLRGKVELMKVIKRKKTAEMNCTMSINLGTSGVQDLRCK